MAWNEINSLFRISLSFSPEGHQKQIPLKFLLDGIIALETLIPLLHHVDPDILFCSGTNQKNERFYLGWIYSYGNYIKWFHFVWFYYSKDAKNIQIPYVTI
jgi:hypothetical protein